jgi:hypothetical protein
MRERLYPKEKYPQGHPLLADSLDSLGFLVHAQGNYAEALGYSKRALEMRQDLTELFAAAASEAQAFDLANSLPRTQDVLLSITRHLPETEAVSYKYVWRGKAAITRCLERRQRDLAQALVLSGTKPTSDQDQARRLSRKLLTTRRALARLLLSPARDPKAHRQRLQQLSEEKEVLEKKLAQLLPSFARHQALQRQGHEALVKALPGGTVFIELLRYIRFEHRHGCSIWLPEGFHFW